MNHQVTERDGLFVVRDAAWHGLGEVLPDYPTREQAQQIAHPWEPESEPVYRKTLVNRTFGPPREVYEPVADAKLMTRSDTHASLGVTSQTYEPVMNSTMYDIAEAIEGQDPASVMYETGGSLYGGRKVWLLLRLREPLYVAGDPHGAVVPYFAMQNDHIGNGAFRGQCTMCRIVCDNTAQMADLDAEARGTEFAFAHTKNVADRIEEAQQALAGWRDSIERFQRFSQLLVDTKITTYQRGLFLEEFVPLPPATLVSDRVVTNVKEARTAIEHILDGETCEGIGDTAYGLVQASVEYNNHVRKAQSRESRFKRAYLDKSVVQRDATALALKVSLS